jgi:hypothetical protein
MRRTARGPSSLRIDATETGKPPRPGFPALKHRCEAAA